MDKERIKLEQKRRQQLARIESENFLKEGPEDITKLYRPFSMNMSKYRNHEKRTLFKELDFASQ
jgi:aspartyl-tRNA synthetase